MFDKEADLFFMSPREHPKPPQWFSVLYLLRRDIDQCMGLDPDTGCSSNSQALWPGAMAILAGIDLLGKFFAGSDDRGDVSKRFQEFLAEFRQALSASERYTIYQLRNALLHSFGLYSKSSSGRVYRFFLTAEGQALVSNPRTDECYFVDLRMLHQNFEEAIQAYQAKLKSKPDLQQKFRAMFTNYGRVWIG